MTPSALDAEVQGVCVACLCFALFLRSSHTADVLWQLFWLHSGSHRPVKNTCCIRYSVFAQYCTQGYALKPRTVNFSARQPPCLLSSVQTVSSERSLRAQQQLFNLRNDDCVEAASSPALYHRNDFLYQNSCLSTKTASFFTLIPTCGICVFLMLSTKNLSSSDRQSAHGLLRLDGGPVVIDEGVELAEAPRDAACALSVLSLTLVQVGRAPAGPWSERSPLSHL